MTIPGVIDVHVHFRVPGGEHKEDWSHGTQAAYAGGVVYVCDMPNTTPAITTAAGVRDKAMEIDRTAPHAIAHGLYIGATEDNLEEIQAADRDGLICGVKVYFGTSTGHLTMNSLPALRALMEARLGVPIVIHAEDDAVIAAARAAYEAEHGAITDIAAHSDIRSRDAAVSALETILALVKETAATNVHITHISTAQEVELIRAAKQAGLSVTCDVTPHHLTFTVADYAQHGTRIRCNPPIREQADVDALWEGLRDGTIDIVASDHAPHTLEEKAATEYDAIPSGVPGVQTLLPVLVDGVLSDKLSWEKLVAVTSTNPSQRFQIPVRGEVVIDTEAVTQIQDSDQQSLCGWTPLSGMTLRGAIISTSIDGALYYQV